MKLYAIDRGMVVQSLVKAIITHEEILFQDEASPLVFVRMADRFALGFDPITGRIAGFDTWAHPGEAIPRQFDATLPADIRDVTMRTDEPTEPDGTIWACDEGDDYYDPQRLVWWVGEFARSHVVRVGENVYLALGDGGEVLGLAIHPC